MKKYIYALSTLALFTATTFGLTPPADASQPIAKAGRVTADRPNTILNGRGAPSTAIGIDGDFYIDIATLNFYGPKLNNHWPAPVSLKTT